ncbi:MAG: hypothetical protein ACLQFX_07805 [Acidimicrobiales bacterium]
MDPLAWARLEIVEQSGVCGRRLESRAAEPQAPPPPPARTVAELPVGLRDP